MIDSSVGHILFHDHHFGFFRRLATARVHPDRVRMVFSEGSELLSEPVGPFSGVTDGIEDQGDNDRDHGDGNEDDDDELRPSGVVNPCCLDVVPRCKGREIGLNDIENYVGKRKNMKKN